MSSLSTTYVEFPADAIAHIVLEETCERYIIIGDIHGCITELRMLLKECSYDESRDKVICVGDLVNKGPSSLEVVQYFMDHNFYAVKGNHDDAALMHLSNWRKSGEINNTYKWVLTMSSSCEKYLLRLPFTIRIPSMNSIIVHAGLVPGIPLNSQPLGALYRMRNLVIHENRDDDETDYNTSVTNYEMGKERYEPTQDTDKGEPWAKQWKGPEIVIFGHDALRKLQVYQWALGIDTGCCYGGKLTACILPGRKLVHVDALQMYSKPSKN